MKHNIKDREFDKFRAAENDLSKVATVLEQIDPVPVFQTFGIAKKLFGQSVTDPDNDVTVITYAVTEDKLRILTVNLSCFIEGKMTVLINGVAVATSRTAPSKPDASVLYSPFLELVTGDEIEIKFKARALSPVSEVESYINACEC